MATSLQPAPTLYTQRRKPPTAVGQYAVPGATMPGGTMPPGTGDANPPAPPPTGGATPTGGANSPTGAGTYSDPLGVAGTGNATPTPQSLAPKGPASPDAPPGATAPTAPTSPAAAAPRLTPPSSPTDVNGALPSVNTTMPGDTTAAAGATGSQFGPGNDLRFSTILPTPSARTASTQGLVDQAAQGVAGQSFPAAVGSFADQFANRLPTGQVAMPSAATDVAAGAAVNPTDSSELANFKSLQDAAANAVGNGTSRQDIAQNALDAFDLRAAPQLRDQIRSVGQQAAKFGRLGMGDTSVETLKPYTDYLTQRAALSKDLAAETATGDIQDRLNKLAATQGLVGQQSGIESANRGEQRTERGYSTDVASQNLARQTAERNAQTGQANTNVDRAYQAARDALTTGLGAAQAQGTEARANTDTLASLEGQQAGEDTTAANATRGERQYQSDTSQQAITNAINQYLLQQQAQNQQFNQGATLAQLGTSGSAINSILQNAGLSGADASSAYEAIAKLLAPAMAGKTGG